MTTATYASGEQASTGLVKVDLPRTSLNMVLRPVFDTAPVGVGPRRAHRAPGGQIVEGCVDVVDEFPVLRRLALAVRGVVDRSRVDEYAGTIDDKQMRSVRSAVCVADGPCLIAT